MQINYNVTGAERKSLVGAISQELNAPTKYLGAPTFAYEVGGYHIDKNGILRGDDNPELVADLQGLHDFKAITEEYDTPLPEAEPIPEDVQIPYEAGLGGRANPYCDYEEPPAYGGPEQGDELEANRLTIEMPRSTFTDMALENLKRLVESKSSLIQKALGTDYSTIISGEETINFPWFQGELTSDEVKAYTHFVTALCEMAKTQQRVNATEKQVENEKYAFRCFLIRLGFVGTEYKMERKILLKNLTGNSAFKNGTPTKAEEVTADE
ncbi:virulence protein [Clostridium sp. 'White wine YQ']|uniref:virulence protein n=1 Tax=Clostridium sp. 'White wine YQ' TaxID=3027474 RepID=UPI002366B030|nr:virulence protein [Clostridium sp. 'White wine YQ']MDD7795593.1 virulence protein [Clostridium sp. 'White wine YQ']